MEDKKRKKIPEFGNEDEERNFWASADSAQYVDWSPGKRRKLVNLRPTLRTISLRLPVSMIEDLKVLANRRDVPYQSLLKVFREACAGAPGASLVNEGDLQALFARCRKSDLDLAARGLGLEAPLTQTNVPLAPA
jgi:predicted DNA binding CopG/RHH family protein